MFFLPVTVSAATLIRQPNNFGLISYWALNEGAGSTVGDFSINENEGTFVNLDEDDWSTDENRVSLNFDSPLEYITVSDSDTWAFGSDDFTITLWMKFDSLSGDWWGRTWLGQTQGSGNVPKWYFTFDQTTNKTLLHINNGGGSNISSDSWTPDLGTWYHIVVTRTGGNTYAFYVDGVENGTTSNSATIPNVSQDLWIGRGEHEGVSFDGEMDDIRMYNRALSSAEVAALATNTSLGYGRVTRKQASNRGLVGHWSFNEGSGTQAGDFSSNKNTGTITDATWVNGKFGKALSFDGTDDSVTVGDIPQADFGANDFSISFWAKWSTATVANIISKREACLHRNFFEIQHNSNGSIALEVDDWGNDYYSIESTGVALNDNQFHHIMFTREGSTLSVYIDGVLNNSSTEATITNLSNAVSLLFGISVCGTGQGSSEKAFIGMLDDVRIYNRALSVSEALALRGSGQFTANASQNNQQTTGLVGLWSFNGPDISGTTVYDRSGQGNNGTLTNGPTKVQGRVGQALSFDGTDDYVAINHSSDLVPSSEITLSAWVYPEATGDNYDFISKFDVGAQRGYNLRIDSNNTLVFDLSTGATNSWVIGNTVFSTNQWHHVVATYNGSAIKVYVNGVEDGSTAVSGSIYSSTADLFIGRIDPAYAANRYFEGKIDEVRIYDKALTAAEVKQLYNFGK